MCIKFAVFLSICLARPSFASNWRLACRTLPSNEAAACLSSSRSRSRLPGNYHRPTALRRALPSDRVTQTITGTQAASQPVSQLEAAEQPCCGRQLGVPSRSRAGSWALQARKCLSSSRSVTRVPTPTWTEPHGGIPRGPGRLKYLENLNCQCLENIFKILVAAGHHDLDSANPRLPAAK